MKETELLQKSWLKLRSNWNATASAVMRCLVLTATTGALKVWKRVSCAVADLLLEVVGRLRLGGAPMMM
jgi:hypothetical protein